MVQAFSSLKLSVLSVPSSSPQFPHGQDAPWMVGETVSLFVFLKGPGGG